MEGELREVLECKWTREIVVHLAEGSARFNEIERAIARRARSLTVSNA